jgi:hypothetical protein
MDIGARPIVMQMSVLASRPYIYRISADSYEDLRMGSARIHVGAPPTVMQENVLESRLRIGLILYGYRSSADSYAEERVGVTSAYWAHTVWISERGR